jgi:hypothetical protein
MLKFYGLSIRLILLYVFKLYDAKFLFMIYYQQNIIMLALRANAQSATADFLFNMVYI